MEGSDKSPTTLVQPPGTMEDIFNIKVLPSLTPLNGVVSSDVTIDPSRSLWYRIFVPVSTSSASSIPVIIYFHGGGFIAWTADCKVCDDHCRWYARELSAIVVCVSYRLAPEHKCPAQYEDGFDALKFIDRTRRIDGNFPANADITKCFLAGDSSGANIAHHLAVEAAKHKFQELKIVGIILIQAFFGAEERSESELEFQWNPIISLEHMDWIWKQFLPEESNRDHPAVNVFGPKSKDISGLIFPAALVVTSGLDPLRDWSRRYCEWLMQSGKEAELIEYPNVPHSFYAYPHVPEACMAIREMQKFMQNQLTK
ncbi:hypothetical protein Ancab_002335 [Ancistrocladus abbreviatus]